MNNETLMEKKNQCTAKSKQSGVRCRKYAAPGFTVCRMHGGATPRGIASPNYKGKGHSKHLPTRLMDRYQESLADPELLSMRADIALVDSRLMDIMTRVDTGESGSAWKQARNAFNELREAIADSDPAKMGVALRELDKIIGRGLTDYAAWHEIGNLLEQRRRIIESEQKRLVAAQLMISAESATTMIFDIIDIVKRNIDDPNKLRQISEDITRLTSRNTG